MNYKEQVGEAVKWTRAYQIRIDNQYGTAPQIAFYEEEAVLLGQEVIVKPAGHIAAIFNSPADGFDVLDPVSNAVVSHITYGELQAILYSLYLDLATKRDLASVAVPYNVPLENLPE